jgi:DMSO/TMAO reductase YedYZ molybdopterin-dependent catalytic subunit
MPVLWGHILAAFWATLATFLAMGACRFTLGTPFLPEVIAQHLFALATPSLMTAALRLFGFGAKWIVFVLAIIGVLGGGVGLGWLYARWLQKRGRLPSARSGSLFGILVGAALMALDLPVLGAGFFGGELRHGRVLGVGVWLALHLLYGALLGLALRRPGSSPLPAGPDRSRRRAVGRRLFLRRLLLWPAFWWAGRSRGWATAPEPPATAAAEVDVTALPGLTPEVTPQEKFYTVSKNLFDPTIEAQAWRLSIHGLVDRPLRLSLHDLQALPVYQAYVTFICISNEIGGHLIGNAQWQGVRLHTLLAQAEVRAEARKVVLRSADGYSTGVPLARCLRPETFLAYGMNGRPLPKAHGFPLRAVIPGYYGMKQPKWLTEIELVADDYQGYWESRGWADEAVVKTMSRIDVPPHRSHASQPNVAVGGIAFAGERGFSAVELSSDGGKTWQGAVLKPALSPWAWSLWRGTLLLPREGAFLLAVRGTDGHGNLQEERVSEPLPDGASGYHKVRLTRRGS